MQTPGPSSSTSKDFAVKVSRLGLTALTTSALAMLYKLAMPRVLGPLELAQWYFAETFPYLFVSIVPFGIGSYIAREIAGDLNSARQSLASILCLEAMFGICIYIALILALMTFYRSQQHSIVVPAIMGITCLAVVLQQRIMRPIFIALNATVTITRIEIIGKFFVSSAILTVMYWHPSIQLMASVLALCESAVLTAQIWSASRLGWILNNICFGQILKILKASLPFSGAAIILGFNGNIDSSLFTLLTNPYETGLFAASSRLGMIILFGVSLVFSSVMPILGQVSRTAPQDYANIFAGVMRLICAFGLPLSLGFVLLAPLMTKFLLGQEFADSAHALAIYAPYSIIIAFNTIASSHLALHSSGRRFFLAISTSFVLNILTAALGISIAYIHFDKGSAGIGRLIAGILGEFSSSLLLLGYAKKNHVSRQMLVWLLTAIFPGLLVATAQINGWLEPWPLRCTTIILVIPYLFAFGLLRLGDCRELLAFLRKLSDRYRSNQLVKTYFSP